jgi:hypothetical protein
MENLGAEIRPHQNLTLMNSPLNEDTLDRLAQAIMLKHSVGYHEALEILSRFRLNLVCDATIARSPSLQAALLTAVNSGKRAFHGGVFVSMPQSIPCLLNWPGVLSLNAVVEGLGASFTAPSHDEFSHTLYLGRQKERVSTSFLVVCSGWRGGIVPAGIEPEIVGGDDFALGGIAAAALGVAQGFLAVSGISSRPVHSPQGISLWRPDLPWASLAADGPAIETLPKNLWMLGLGHLGQAYLWAFSLLPYAQPEDLHILLQDFDSTVVGNYSSGLLCERHNTGQRKTRVCSGWLEERGIQTTITERRFDAFTRRTEDEPYIACCGFDSAEARRILEEAGFDLVIECALGSDTARFDRIILHTFPDASRKAQDIWSTTAAAPAHKQLVRAFQTSGDCGILAETLAKKAISTSFSGAFAGALVAGELVRALHGGIRFEYIHAHLRHGDSYRTIVRPENYQIRVARGGFTTLKRGENVAA